MKIHNEFEQGSADWMIFRSGRPTASEFDRIITPKWEVRRGQMPESYLAEKLAEWWLGGPLAGANTFDMDQGRVLEEEARPWYSLTYDVEVETVGIVTTDDGRIACSPDGLIGKNCGIEIKCPQPHTHAGYLLAGKLPDHYAAQVHGSMYVTGVSQWKFLSYRRHFPPLVLTVERDDRIIGAISEALAGFLAKFELGQQRLCEINGGPPKRLAPMTTKQVRGLIDPDDYKM